MRFVKKVKNMISSWLNRLLYKAIMSLKIMDHLNFQMGGCSMTAKIAIVDKPIKADITDVADWFLLKGNMSNKKIQKLCYYAEAWSLTLLDQDIANHSEFEAWVHGPVNRTLYQTFKGYGWHELKITNREEVMARMKKLFTPEQIEVLEAVWDTYGEYGADQLEALTHTERPWLEQRVGLGKFESSHSIISSTTMKEYYKSIEVN
ncbi:Panacea domain-containing protein [Catenibacterium faecis]|uniref:Panacea domain-containing protein n=1 Tax=Catenibacterium TaxID=135858 RepID=UPI003F7ED6EE